MQDATVAPQPTTATQTATPVVAPQAGGPYTAREMYEAAQVHRRLVRDQLNGAESERQQVAQQLRQPDVIGADRAGLEQRLAVLDTRVLDLQNQLSEAQNREAQAAAVPGATRESPEEAAADRFEVAMTVGLLITLFLAVPIVIAYARRLWKKSAVVLSMTPELDRRLDSIDRALETTALEVERIGEGQRFVTQLLAKRGDAQAAALPDRSEPG